MARLPFGLAEKRIQPQWRIVEDRIPEKLGAGFIAIVSGSATSPARRTNERLPQRSSRRGDLRGQGANDHLVC
ncbi:hypothetical protein HGG75_26150 [Ochrobactrum pseudogrignonense]|nr:hypothetical protein [Brucella pseudogrignonensis]